MHTYKNVSYKDIIPIDIPFKSRRFITAEHMLAPSKTYTDKRISGTFLPYTFFHERMNGKVALCSSMCLHKFEVQMMMEVGEEHLQYWNKMESDVTSQYDVPFYHERGRMVDMFDRSYIPQAVSPLQFFFRRDMKGDRTEDRLWLGRCMCVRSSHTHSHLHT